MPCRATALVGKAFFIYWPHGIPFLNDGRGYPDGPNPIFDNDYLGPFFYNYTRDANGNPVLDPTYPKLPDPVLPRHREDAPHPLNHMARMHRIR